MDLILPIYIIPIESNKLNILNSPVRKINIIATINKNIPSIHINKIINKIIII